MNIKELLNEGCSVKMPYKTDRNDWVGEVTIWVFAGGCGMKPKIQICGSAGHEEFAIHEIDKAVERFTSLVFRPENLMYKMNQALINNNDPDIDLDVEEDLETIIALRQELLDIENGKQSE